MDNIEIVPDLHGSVTERENLRGDPESRSTGLTVDDLHEVRFDSLLQIGDIVRKYGQLDIPKEESLVFIHQLTQARDAWFVEAGEVGLIYLTEVMPRRDALFHFVFWDGHFRADREAACKTVLTEAFSRFALDRISAEISQQNVPMKRFLRDLGFTLEGVTRRGWSIDPPVDTIHYGLLSEEKPWPVLPMEEEDGI